MADAETTKWKIPPVEEFIKAWEESETLEEVRKKLKAPNVQAVSVHATMWRVGGVPLKEFPKKVVKAQPKMKPTDRENALKVLAKIKGTSVKKLDEEGQKKAAEIKAKRAEKKAEKEKAELAAKEKAQAG
jgi:hypothetical protein